MDNALLTQLSELVQACHRAGIKPIICGGLGVYLSFFKKQNDICNMIRATQDIDLMLSKSDLVEEAKRKAIAEIITNELEYIVCDDKRCHGFVKGQNRQLDILVPPVEKLARKNYRVQIIKSKLHGYFTKEAQFIDENLRPVSLFDIQVNFKGCKEIVLYIPSPTNLMIMKLYAFNDRIEGARKSVNRAIDHAWDLFIAIMLTDRNDYLEGQEFLLRHSGSKIIRYAQTIVVDKFSDINQSGWRSILGTSNFYPELTKQEKESKLDEAGRRLVRWFKIT